jgi:hypothetical protein
MDVLELNKEGEEVKNDEFFITKKENECEDIIKKCKAETFRKKVMRLKKVNLFLLEHVHEEEEIKMKLMKDINKKVRKLENEVEIQENNHEELK